jgi:hypothetical protein
VRWSDLYNDQERLAVVLSEIGIRPIHLILDVRDVPELRERCELLKDPARLLLALQWFGDQGHPQPSRAERTS